MSHHFQSPQVIENVSKEEIAFSLCDEKNSMEGIFRGSLDRMLKKSSPGRFQRRNREMRYLVSFPAFFRKKRTSVT